MQSKFTRYTLNNVNGMQVSLLNYGAALTSVKIPDPQKRLVELTLGFDQPEEYLQHPFYFGCTVGRVANRIASGTFNLNNKPVTLARNEKNFCHLHGGAVGFDKIFWKGKHVANGVEFSYYSPAGEEGYSGNLQVIVTYTLTPANELKITYLAQTDAPTPINLTNHAYWNLAGAGNGNVLNHEMEIFADYYLESDAQHLPTGNILPVADSAFDFRKPRTIGERLAEASGYDHCYVLGKNRLVARVQEPTSKRILETYTTQPGMQFYSGNYLSDYAIANGKRTEQWGGFCLETQGYPDAPNQPNFPSVILMPGEFYTYETVYKLIF
jgi:aldose 1-epimerase